MIHLNSRVARIVAGLAVVSAFAVAPMAAQAATTDATGTLTGGSLSNNAPAITPFGVTLSGVNQTVITAVGATTLVDARARRPVTRSRPPPARRPSAASSLTPALADR